MTTPMRYIYRRGRLIAVAAQDATVSPVVAVIDWWRHGGDRPERPTPPSSSPQLPLLTVIDGRRAQRPPSTVERPTPAGTGDELAS